MTLYVNLVFEMKDGASLQCHTTTFDDFRDLYNDWNNNNQVEIPGHKVVDAHEIIEIKVYLVR